MKNYKTVLLLITLLTSFSLFSQSDSLKIEEGSKKNNNKTHKSPSKAMMLSVLPGLGQVYNRKYWKLPIIYTALGITTYFAVTNHNTYLDFLNALRTRNSNSVDKYSGLYTDQQLIDNINYYQNNRDLSIIIGVVFYAANLLDAYIDAHLFDFDVSDDLSINIRPWREDISYLASNSAVGLSLGFKF